MDSHTLNIQGMSLRVACITSGARTELTEKSSSLVKKKRTRESCTCTDKRIQQNLTDITLFSIGCNLLTLHRGHNWDHLFVML